MDDGPPAALRGHPILFRALGNWHPQDAEAVGQGHQDAHPCVARPPGHSPRCDRLVQRGRDLVHPHHQGVRAGCLGRPLRLHARRRLPPHHLPHAHPHRRRRRPRVAWRAFVHATGVPPTPCSSDGLRTLPPPDGHTRRSSGLGPLAPHVPSCLACGRACRRRCSPTSRRRCVRSSPRRR